MKHYFYDGRSLQDALITDYHDGLVVLSVVIACLASYATLGVAGRIKATERARSGIRLSWLIAGALTMGGGVWAMHFIAMLALKLPLTVSYDITMTALSTVPSIIASAVMLHVLSRPRNKKPILFIGGALMGAGIGAMHYLGMEAMEGVNQQLIMLYDPKLFVASVIVAVALANAALFISYYWQRSNSLIPGFWVKAVPTLAMGFAVSGMHYTAMAATYFFPGEAIVGVLKDALNPGSLAFWVAFDSISIMSLAILMTIVDSRLQQAAYEQTISRSRLREAIESIDDSFALYDTNDQLVECNQHFRKLMDCGRGIVPGMTFEAINRAAAEAGLILEATGRIDEWLADRLASHRAPRGQIIESLRDGRWMSTRERRVWDMGTVAVSTDITELKQEQAFREQVLFAEAVMERHRSLARMVAGIAHEINTPLGIASTASSIIENRLLEPKTRALLSCNEENKEILEDLLESTVLLKNNIIRAHKLVESFKKISVGEASDKQEIVKLPDLLQDSVDLFKINARQAKLAITIDSTGLKGIQEWLGYPGHMTQVIMNLLQNIERYAYADNKGGLVDICIFDDNDQFFITVRDYGQGIPVEALNKIFEPFFTTGRNIGGTGLGLSIVSNIVTTLFKGSIKAISEPGKGCCFTLTFPKKTDNGSEISTPIAATFGAV